MRACERPLPAAIFEASEASSARLAMAQARERLSDLEAQLSAFELAELFRLHPRLKLFDFALDSCHTDEGRSVLTPEPYPHLFPDPQASRFDELGARQSLRQALRDFLGGLPEAYLLRLAYRRPRFCRPPEGEPLAEGVLAQFLEPDAFARWQAACLARAAAPNAAAALSPPRTL